MDVLLYHNNDTSGIKQKLTFPYMEMMYEKDSIADLWGNFFFFLNSPSLNTWTMAVQTEQNETWPLPHSI